MQAFKAGDEEAFVTLFRKYRDRLVSFCRRMLRDEARAEEAAQEVFLRLYAARSRYQPKSRFSTFIYRIATNLCLNLRARAEHRLVDRDAEAAAQPSSNASAEAELNRARLRRSVLEALARLPETQAAALVLCHYEGLSLAEAAVVLEASESAIKSLLFRARQSMVAMLAPEVGEEGASHAVR